MKQLAIIYGSSTDNTLNAATKIAEGLKELSPELLDVRKIKPQELTEYRYLILGTSTWNIGDLQDDWGIFLPKLRELELSNTTIFLFGLGDSGSYPDTFVDGMGELYEFFTSKGCRVLGAVDTKGYNFDDSRAFVDGKFVGLALDADNEDNLTEQRILQWIEAIRPVIA
jgi:flavodoxin, long chain